MLNPSRRVFVDRLPMVPPPAAWLRRAVHSFNWIGEAGEFDRTPRVVGFRCRFVLGAAATFHVHVSADERYELFLNGKRVGRGPERGDRLNWFAETYELSLPPGEHVLVARTWWLGDAGASPYSSMTVRHAFTVVAEGVPVELLNTGVAPWECKRLSGYEWLSPGEAWGCGAKQRIVGSQFDWGWERGLGDGWRPVKVIADAVTNEANDQPRHWRLRPAVLPAMLDDVTHVGIARHVAAAQPGEDVAATLVRSADHLDGEAPAWNAMLAGEGNVTVAPHTLRRVIIDLQQYYTAYSELITTGGLGSRIRVGWLESLYERRPERDWIGNMPKGHRDAIEGKFFTHSVGDEFLPDGGAERFFDTLWFEAGRFVELQIQTADDALVINAFRLRVTHYPTQQIAAFESSDQRLARVMPLALRALQTGSHEVFIDSPYYEQIQYIGDTRLECLTTYAAQIDARLPRKAIELVDYSRDPVLGITQARYPSRITQFTWGYSLWWCCMVHDYLMWRGEPDFVKARLPGVRAALDAALGYVNADHLVVLPVRPNFNFVDWTPGWNHGLPERKDEPNAVSTFHLAYTLDLAAKLERAVGEPELAARFERHAREITSAAISAFWDDSRGLFSDVLDRSKWSEHTQILALLPGLLPSEIAARCTASLLSDPGLHRATIYFMHYLFELLYRIGRTDILIQRMQTWFDLEQLGLKTLTEMPEPTRSDNHGWGSHVVYHYFASILGIRPASIGFGRVRIEPKLGSLSFARGIMAHPRGDISVEIGRDGPSRIKLPPGVTGTFVHSGKVVELMSGTTEL